MSKLALYNPLIKVTEILNLSMAFVGKYGSFQQFWGNPGNPQIKLRGSQSKVTANIGCLPFPLNSL